MNVESRNEIQGNGLTMKQAAGWFGVSTRTIYTWKRLSGFPRVRKIGAVARISRVEIERWMNNQVEEGGR